MSILELYRAVNASHWNILVPIYFFILSVSAGTVMVITLAEFLKIETIKMLKRPGYIIGLAAIAIAPVFIILDLGKPSRFINMLNPANFQITSPMSWGGWLLIVFGITLLLISKNYLIETFSPAATQAASASQSSPSKNGFVFTLALLVAAYPGIELGIVNAKLLWHSELLPVYFITTTILAGLAVLGLLLTVYKEKAISLSSYVLNGMFITILLSLALIAFRTIILLGAGGTGSEIINALWSSKVFVLGELILGLIVPLIILLFGKAKSNPILLFTVSMLILIGVFSMRYVLVMIGQAI